jgi:hypothetical protein
LLERLTQRRQIARILSPEIGLAMLRLVLPTVAILILIGILVSLRKKSPPPAAEHCSHTDYGHGVTCINGAGEGGNDINMTSRTVAYCPTAGHTVIAAAYTCADKDCQNVPVTRMTIGDNLHDPEPCLVASPHSPFALNETSSGTQKLQEYIWVCPNIPAGITSFTATCRVPNACTYITLTVTEWTGLATTDVFDTDGGGASSVQETKATLSTSSPTRYTNELLYTFMDNTRDLTMTPGPPYRTALQFFPGNIDTAAMIDTPGPQTSSATWEDDDDWYGAIVAIRSAASQPALAHP